LSTLDALCSGSIAESAYHAAVDATSSREHGALEGSDLLRQTPMAASVAKLFVVTTASERRYCGIDTGGLPTHQVAAGGFVNLE
jgi:hypothetical protein